MSQVSNLSTICLSICLLLVGCGAEAPYVDKRVLRDKYDCAFIAKHNFGDNVFMTHNEELSGKNCPLNKASKS